VCVSRWFVLCCMLVQFWQTCRMLNGGKLLLMTLQLLTWDSFLALPQHLQLCLASNSLYVGCCFCLGCRYGLTSSETGRAQIQQIRVILDQFELWCTSIIQLNRPQHLAMLRSNTMEGIRAEVMRYLGWCHKYGQVPHPRLRHMLNPHLLLGFLAFVRARGVIRANLASYVATTIRVVTWLQVTSQLSPTDIARLPGYVTWLHNLQHQLKAHISPHPTPTLDHLISQGRWMQPGQLMKCLDTVYSQAKGVVLAAAAAGFTSDSLPRPKVVQVMEALFCCLFFGFIPPLRPSVAISLQRPGYKGEGHGQQASVHACCASAAAQVLSVAAGSCCPCSMHASACNKCIECCLHASIHSVPGLQHVQLAPGSMLLCYNCYICQQHLCNTCCSMLLHLLLMLVNSIYHFDVLFAHKTCFACCVVLLCLLAGPCRWADCQHKSTCKGNRLEAVPGAFQPVSLPSSSSSSGPFQLQVQQYRLIAPHHKSERHRGRRIEYQLPPELCLLLHFHLRHGLKVLMVTEEEDDEGWEEAVQAFRTLPFVFVMASTRKPMIKQQASQVWKRVVLPESYRFGPQVARSAFATGIRNQQLPRPQFSAAAAAEAMGHTLQVWDSTYDRLYTQQAVQRSVDLMASWRQGVLQQQNQQDQAAAAAAAAAAAIVIEDEDDEEVTAAAVEGATAAYDLNTGDGTDDESWVTA